MSDQADKLNAFAVNEGVIDGETAEQIRNAQKPIVIVPGGETTISESAGQLFGHIAKKKKVFLRDGNVCQLVEKDDILKLELVKTAAACSLFEDYVTFAKRLKGKNGTVGLAPEVISKVTAEQYLTANARYALPEIDALLSCPLITERSGKLHIVSSGYDPITKLLIVKNAPIQDVGVTEAVECLIEVLKDYRFQTPGDRSRAFASFITPALKFGGFIKGPVPADAAEADQSQAGKSYRHQMIAAVYNDTCAVINKQESSGVGGLEEAFSTALVEGRPFIQFDNIRGKFSFQKLESFMTSVGTFPARPAYSPTVQVVPSKFMIFISSNGYQTTPDLSNRSSIIRIFKRPGYEFKTWEPGGVYRGGMREFIQDVQPYILSCVFAVVREWYRHGKPRTKDTRHDMREWCQVLDWIVQNIFKAAPLMDGHEAAQARVSNPDHTFLRQLALTLPQRDQMNVPLRASELVTICGEEGIYIPGVAQDRRHDEKDGATAMGKLMKRVFGASESAEVDVFNITRSTEKVAGDSLHVYPAYFYTFNPTADQSTTQPA